jgi:hypothetical protein
MLIKSGRMNMAVYDKVDEKRMRTAIVGGRERLARS